MGVARGIGIIGTGDIAAKYINSIGNVEALALVACASHDSARADVAGAKFGIEPLTIAELVADPRIEIVVNLTAPANHAAVTAAALAAGKHVYSEKPLAMTGAAADELIAGGGGIIACAPATPLGPSCQTARALIAAGTIGAVVGGSAMLVYPGPEMFHTNPAALYRAGAGPLYDMAVYDLAVLHQILGPIERAAATRRTTHAERSALHGPDAGSLFDVEVPTHYAALIEFASGPVVTMTTSFDAFGPPKAWIDLYGTRGALRLERASAFSGEILLSTELGRWQTKVPTVLGWSDDLWIIGLLDLLEAIDSGTEPRCSAAAARHALAALEAIDDAAAFHSFIDVGHACPSAPPLEPDHYQTLRQRYRVGRNAS